MTLRLTLTVYVFAGGIMVGACVWKLMETVGVPIPDWLAIVVGMVPAGHLVARIWSAPIRAWREGR